MIKQAFYYECDSKDLIEGQKLIKEIENLISLGETFDKGFYKGKILDVLERTIDQRSEFMLKNEEVVISKFKALFNLQDSTFQELFEKVPELTEYFQMKFTFAEDCEDLIEKLIRVFNRLI